MSTTSIGAPLTVTGSAYSSRKASAAAASSPGRGSDHSRSNRSTSKATRPGWRGPARGGGGRGPPRGAGGGERGGGAQAAGGGGGVRGRAGGATPQGGGG